MRQLLYDLNYALAAKKSGRADNARHLLYLEVLLLSMPVITNSVAFVPLPLQLGYLLVVIVPLFAGVWFLVQRVFPRAPSQAALGCDQGLARVWRGGSALVLLASCMVVGLMFFFFPFFHSVEPL